MSRVNSVGSNGWVEYQGPQMRVMGGRLTKKIHVFATNGDDTIKVMGRPDGSVVVSVNGEERVFTRDEAKKLVIHAKGGNDKVIVGRNVPPGLIVDGGRGDDAVLNLADRVKIVGGSGRDQIANFGEGVRIRGGSGNDAIVNLGRGTLVRGDGGHDKVVNLGSDSRIYGGSGNDRIYDSSRHTFIAGGWGRDRVVMNGVDSMTDAGWGDRIEDRDGLNHVQGRGPFRVRRRHHGSLIDEILARKSAERRMDVQDEAAREVEETLAERLEGYKLETIYD